jgi:hypothetical protein
MAGWIEDPRELAEKVAQAVGAQAVTDMHTHLYPPEFGDLLLYGVDELLTYHYLIAEAMRASDIGYEAFWGLSVREQADHIWRSLFLDHSPVSEACRGVLTTLRELGLDPGTRDLGAYREWYGGLTPQGAVDRILEKANVREVVMTNDPFSERERAVWLSERGEGLRRHPRFRAALRIDPLLLDWPVTHARLRAWGYEVEADLHAGSGRTLAEARRFLEEWGRRMGALYLAVSLPPDFGYPDGGAASLLLDGCVVPACAELGVPLALMIGVKRQVNPALRAAGDGVGQAGLEGLARLCARYPRQRFFATLLARENQHELVVLGRKFRNLMPFGCWWFMNNPSLVRETTRMRLEMLGTSVIPQHSDARILDQLVYKWKHARGVIAQVLTEQYAGLLEAGWALREEEIERDVRRLLQDNFWTFLGR